MNGRADSAILTAPSFEIEDEANASPQRVLRTVRRCDRSDQRQRLWSHRNRTQAKEAHRQRVRRQERHHRSANRGHDRHEQGIGFRDRRAASHAGRCLRLGTLQAEKHRR